MQLGWKSVVSAAYHPYDFTLRRDAAKLEAGSLNLLAVHALGAAVDLALEVGVDVIESRLGEAHRASRRGAPQPRTRASRTRRERTSREDFGILSFVPKRPAERVRQDLWERGVVSTVRFGGIRLAPHHYQDDRDVDAFFARLDDAEAAAR